MPTPRPLYGKAAALRPVNQSGQPPWTLIQAETFTWPPPSGDTASVELAPFQAFSIFGLSINSAPTAAQVAAKMIDSGTASVIYYIEAWAQDGRIAGSGWVTWYFIGVYS